MEQDSAVQATAERMDRTARLLWRHREDQPRRRGPRPGRSLDEVVAAGMAIADADGLTGLTVRTLAKRLGLARMGLYNYVDDLDQLVELMSDTASGELLDGRVRGFPYGPRSRSPADRRRGWQRVARTVCEANLELIGRHPWLIEQPNDRPVLGPGAIAKYNAELATFDRLGLGEVEMDLALWQLLNHVRGIAGDLIAARSRGESAEQWWEAGGAAVVADRVSEEEFPLAVRVGSAAGAAQGTAYDPMSSYRFGLSRLLDGLQLLIDRRSPDAAQGLEFRPAAG